MPSVQTTPHRTHIVLTRTVSPTAGYLFFMCNMHMAQGFKTFYCVPYTSSRRLMFHRDLLGVPEPFPLISVYTIVCTISLRTGIGTTCAGPRSGMLSGQMAGKTIFTGYEPNSIIDVSSEHTPINFPFRSNSFNREDDLTNTIAASEDV